jgi:DsbC/DsbD-like thiol-disulfide interchange protein
MKKIVAFFIGLFSFVNLNAQVQNPVSWTTSYKSMSATEGEITITAKIEKGWHTYSQRPTDAGPISTTFTFPPSSQYKLVGKTEENGSHEEFDKAFETKIFVFNETAEFKQKIKLTGKASFDLKFNVECTVCNDNMCLPPKIVDLKVKVQ